MALFLDYPEDMEKRRFYSRYDSPLGDLFLCSGASGLTDVAIGTEEGEFLSQAALKYGSEPVLDRGRFSGVFGILDEYFKGRPVVFRVRLDPAGSVFDKTVWKALSIIPWGSKVSYGELARLIGRNGAARAVGGACGRNPIPLIIPCHRVLGSDGFIGGYSGGEGVKEKLLRLEGVPFKVR